MAIPALQNVQGKMLLPKGIHVATLDEVKIRFGCESKRRADLMSGLEAAVKNFQAAGVSKVYIDGSFTTDKYEPNDIDGCWEPGENFDIKKLDPVFLQFDNGRIEMKKKYGLDFFLSITTEGNSGLTFPEFFQTDRDGNLKGIVVVNLDGA